MSAPITLGQIGGTVEVPDLPAGPALDRLVFEQPTATAAGLIVVGVIGGIIAARNGRARMGQLVVLGAAILAAAVIGAGALVETTRERLLRGAREFVDAAATGRASEVAAMLDERLSLRSAGTMVDQGRDWVIGVVASLPGVVTDHSVRMRGAALEASNRARTRMTVRVRAEGAYSGDIYSSWDLVWIRAADAGSDGWRIAGIDCLSIFGREPDAGWLSEGAGIARRRGGGSGQ